MNRIFEVLPPCIFHTITGYYCPGCGGTRAVLSLLSGHMLRSLYYHPIVLYTVVCLLWYLLRSVVRGFSKNKYTLYMPDSKILLNLAAIIVVVNFLIRNILYIGWGVTL